MSLPKIIVSISQDDYDAIKNLAPDLPDTYDEWCDCQADEIAKLESQGTTFKEVTIDSDGLAVYCHDSNIDHDAEGRRIYAVYVDRRGPYPGTKLT